MPDSSTIPFSGSIFATPPRLSWYQEARRAARVALQGSDLSSMLEEALEYAEGDLAEALAPFTARKVLQEYFRLVGRAEGSGRYELLRKLSFVEVEGEEVFFHLPKEAVEDPSDAVIEFTRAVIEARDTDEWAEEAGMHLMKTAHDDLQDEVGVYELLAADADEKQAWTQAYIGEEEESLFQDVGRHLGDRIGEIALAGIRHWAEETKGGLDLIVLEAILEGGEAGNDTSTPRPVDTAASTAERGGFFPWATGAPSSIGITAIRQAKHGWPEEDHAGRPKYPFTQERPHHVEGQFSIIVPDSNQAGAAVEAEMAQRVLSEFDRHTTRLHLACAAYSVKGDPAKYTPIPRQYVYDMLGIGWDQNDDESRDKKDQKVEEAFRNLCKLGVQITVLDGPDGAPEQLGLESVWSLNTQKWGQKRISDPDRILDTEHWQLLVRPNAWQQLYLSEETGARQFGYFSRKLLENIDWHNNPAAGDLAIELLKYVRFQDGGAPRDVNVEKMLDICGLNQAQKSWKQTRNRQKLERAILQQERWGWDVEWTRWPDDYRPDNEHRPDFPDGWWQGKKAEGWESSFREWKVTFYPPEDLAEMNSRAERIDNSDPHELEPKGWPDRIKTILNETEYIQADLARILEVTPAAVTQWKKGNRTPEGPHRAKLKDIERRNGLRNN